MITGRALDTIVAARMATNMPMNSPESAWSTSLRVIGATTAGSPPGGVAAAGSTDVDTVLLSAPVPGRRSAAGGSVGVRCGQAGGEDVDGLVEQRDQGAGLAE